LRAQLTRDLFGIAKFLCISNTDLLSVVAQNVLGPHTSISTRPRTCEGDN